MFSSCHTCSHFYLGTSLLLKLTHNTDAVPAVCECVTGHRYLALPKDLLMKMQRSAIFSLLSLQADLHKDNVDV